ncbi:MAG: hypothetical protein K2X37_14050 [Chitinophagaceae bacterium]|nr:hypothetical protein [Chitinophagaceae bacterium]
MLIITEVLSAQQYTPKTMNPTANSKKILQALITTLKKQTTPLYTVFDSITFKKIMVDKKPIFEQFYSKHIRSYALTKDDAFLDSSVQSILLYNNAQYLKRIPDSLVQVREDKTDTQKGFQQHPLGKYCRTALAISIILEEEEFAVYCVLLDEENKILGIAPLIYFQEVKPTPKINKAITPLLKWREKALTVYKLEVLRQ